MPNPYQDVMVKIRNFSVPADATPDETLQTLCRAFNQSADKFNCFGPLTPERDGVFRPDLPTEEFMVITARPTADQMKTLRPADVTIVEPTRYEPLGP